MAKHRKYEQGASATAKPSGHVGRHQQPSTGDGKGRRAGKISAGNIVSQGTVPQSAGTRSRLRLPKWLGGQ